MGLGSGLGLGLGLGLGVGLGAGLGLGVGVREFGAVPHATPTLTLTLTLTLTTGCCSGRQATLSSVMSCTSAASVPAPPAGRWGGAVEAASGVGARAARVRERRKRVWVASEAAAEEEAEAVAAEEEEAAARCISSRWAENAWRYGPAARVRASCRARGARCGAWARAAGQACASCEARDIGEI